MADTNDISVVEEPIRDVAKLASIPSRLLVASVLEVQLLDHGLGGILLVERRLSEPYEKDYDRYVGEGPLRWHQQFETSNWGLLMARAGEANVGGAVVAWTTPGIHLLEERDDVAALWDIRVRPEDQGRGVGRALFSAAEGWARARGCDLLKVETQNVNVPACQFYVRQGCALASVNRFAYPELPNDTQLIWCKRL